MPKATANPPSADRYYYCASTALDGLEVFAEDGARNFRDYLRKLEDFSGIEVIACLLEKTTFHLILRVPAPESLPPLTEQALLALLPQLYEDSTQLVIRAWIAQAKDDAAGEELPRLLARYQSRRGNLSEFIKGLKQRHSRWYNRKHHRRGSLWQDRFSRVELSRKAVAALSKSLASPLPPPALPFGQ